MLGRRTCIKVFGGVSLESEYESLKKVGSVMGSMMRKKAVEVKDHMIEGLAIKLKFFFFILRAMECH